MSYISVEYVEENWMVSPAALAVGEPSPATLAAQRWLLSHSGVIKVGLNGETTGVPGNNVHDWRRETLRINPDVASSMTYAFTHYGITQPPTSAAVLSVQQSVAHITVSSFMHKGALFPDDDPEPEDAPSVGVAVDAWRLTPQVSAMHDGQGRPIANVFEGIDVDIAMYGGVVLHRLSFQVSLLATIAFAMPPWGTSRTAVHRMAVSGARVRTE